MSKNGKPAGGRLAAEWDDPQLMYLGEIAAARPRRHLLRPTTWPGGWRYLMSFDAGEHLRQAAVAARRVAEELELVGRPEGARWLGRADSAHRQASRAGALLLAVAALDPSAWTALVASRQQHEHRTPRDGPD